MAFHVPEKHRVMQGPLMSTSADGNNGAFMFNTNRGDEIRTVARDFGGWEHVSVSLEHRTPTWEEMCVVKNLFWDDEDCVVQFHPPKSDYVNCHPYCLHLWRQVGVEFPRPPSIMVG